MTGCGPDTFDSPAEDHEPGVRIRALLESGDRPVLSFPTGDTVHFDEDVVRFYRTRNFEPAWTDREGFRPRGEALVEALQEVRAEGLPPETYHADLIRQLMERVVRQHEEGLAVGDALGNLDILMSEAFLGYTTDLRRGTIDPREGGHQWQIDREDPTDAEFLNGLVESGDFEASLDSVRPRVPFYNRTKDALARYRAIEEAGGWPTVPDGETLEEDMTGERVTALRRRLLAEQDEEEIRFVRAGERPDSFDADLRRAVEHFQTRHGIDSDGRVGDFTLEELNHTVDERISSLKLNLDRWRWLPRHLGEHYVLVNVAGFEAVIMKDDEPAFTSNVVVGQEGWETPLFQDTLEYVVVNPYWNVPASIKNDEILPAVRRDPGYLARNNYQVLDSDGNVVDGRSVNLSSDAYRVRQRPGAGNALGDVKFLFPNDHNIYLHDTPAQDLFNRSGRAFSHGCIRVEKAAELAEYLFRNTTSRSPDEFHALRAGSEEKWIEMEEKLPVHIVYFTAWVDADGTTHFYHDVYGRDRGVERIARGKLSDSPVQDRSSQGTGGEDAGDDR